MINHDKLKPLLKTPVFRNICSPYNSPYEDRLRDHDACPLWFSEFSLVLRVSLLEIHDIIITRGTHKLHFVSEHNNHLNCLKPLNDAISMQETSSSEFKSPNSQGCLVVPEFSLNEHLRCSISRVTYKVFRKMCY